MIFFRFTLNKHISNNKVKANKGKEIHTKNSTILLSDCFDFISSFRKHRMVPEFGKRCTNRHKIAILHIPIQPPIQACMNRTKDEKRCTNSRLHMNIHDKTLRLHIKCRCLHLAKVKFSSSFTHIKIHRTISDYILSKFVELKVCTTHFCQSQLLVVLLFFLALQWRISLVFECCNF